MTRGTTPTLIFDFCGCVALELADKALVTFKQDGEVLFDKDIDLVENIKDNKVYVSLTQEETLLLKAGSYVQYQMRLLINGGAYATPIYKDVVLDVLNDTHIGDDDEYPPTISGDDFSGRPKKVFPCTCTEQNVVCASIGKVSYIKGEDGFSPTISVKEDSEGVYILNIKDINGEYDTPNLKGDAVLKSEKGVPNGVATLDDTGKVPASQLPSYVDDVKEYQTFSDFPKIGEQDKIYVSKETNITYRWSGTSYVEISSSIALGETAQTAYAGDKGKRNADNIVALQTEVGGLNAIYRFSESSVSSSFSGTTELYKTDLIGDGLPRKGDHVLFPDNKSNVMFIGTISHVNDETYTIDNIKYINDALKASGDWVMGVTANFPEMYNYNGGTWLCLTRDVVTAPEKGKEWFCISAPAPVTSVAGKTGEVSLATITFKDNSTAPTTVEYNGSEEKEVYIPRPVYFKLNGAVMQDTGGVDTDYMVAISNLTPSYPVPIVGDIVVFSTSDNVYIGLVKEAQSAGLTVTAKLKIENSGL